MILENQKLGENDGVTIVQFGEGDLNVGSVKQDEEGYAGVVLWDRSKSTIGTIMDSTGMVTDELPIKMLLAFTSIESIDVVIGKLKEAKGYLTELNK